MRKSEGSKKTIADICLIAFFLILAAVLFITGNVGSEQGAWVVVRVNGEETERYPLSTDGTYELNGGTNILVISSNEAWLCEADCPDKLCVRQGHIRASGQVITCLPNKLTVTIEGVEGEVDIIT